MSTPYFSVLVAAYNVDKYLDECLTSLIQQTYLDAEFIVVDDASTDNTKQICEGFAQRDVRFKLVRNEKNEGLLAVRKKAVKMARGQFVVFLDGDDCLASTEALRKLFKNPCSQAELNKIVPFGFSLQRQKMVFFCHQNSIILLC